MYTYRYGISSFNYDICTFLVSSKKQCMIVPIACSCAYVCACMRPYTGTVYSWKVFHILIYKIGLKTLNNGSHSQSTTENTLPTIKRDKATSQAVQLGNCSFDCSRGALLSNGVNIYQFLSLDVVSFSSSSSLGGGTGPSSFSLSSSSSSSLALFLFSSLALSNLDLN